MIRKNIKKIVDYPKYIEKLKCVTAEFQKDIDLDYNLLGQGDGIWAVPRNLISNISEPVVLSFGIGFDIEFEKDLNKLFSAKVYAYDPTPRAVDWIKKQKLPKNINFRNIGLGAKNQEVNLYATSTKDTNPNFSRCSQGAKKSYKVQVNTLKTIMQKEKINNIDILKIDIEGMEYEVLRNILSKRIFPKCILVEFHHKRFGIKKRETNKILKKLKQNGYLRYYVSRRGFEYGLIKSEYI